MDTYTISQINKYIKNIIESDGLLKGIWLKGEISNFKAHNSGHLYFTLKDEGAVLQSVMFRGAASGLGFVPQNGMKVMAKCDIRVYEPAGSYQAYIAEMKQDGLGDLHIAFEQLKQKLSAEGLFDASRKKPIPKFPSAIGIVTSPTGAAIQDMLNILNRRWKYPQIYIYPTLVQGTDAPPQIIEGIKYFNEKNNVDVIITGRGGGSIEDLWAFNDEGVARCIAASHIPVISAVGHEVDFTIADFVADLRAATPSEAAERAVPLSGELKTRIKTAQDKLAAGLKKTAVEKRLKMQQLDTGRVFESVKNAVDSRRLDADRLSEAMINQTKLYLERERKKLTMLATGLDNLSPLGVLGRGYSITFGQKGKVVTKTTDVKTNDIITVKLADGEIGAKVTHIGESVKEENR